jgi:hypothetical protein
MNFNQHRGLVKGPKVDVQKIPYPNNGGPKPDGPAPRVESGPVQFGNDWPGLFIRGDDCFGLANAISEVARFLNSLPDAAKVQSGLPLAFAWDQILGIRETIQQEVIQK